MGGRSRISRVLLPWRLSVVVAIVCLGCLPEARSLRTSPFIGKYSKERLENVGGAPPPEVVPEVIVPEVIAPPVQKEASASSSAFQVGVVAKSSPSGLNAEEEGGNATTKSPLTGIPQIDYLLDPNLPRELNGYDLSEYPFYNGVPKGITFKCDGLHDGFYASVLHKCQVYHHCLFGTRYDFLCANYTAFDQKTFICHFVSEVDCDNSPKYYKRNEALYKEASTTTTSTTTTTTTTTPAPKPQSESSGGRGGLGARRRRPLRRRRPMYEYYYEDDYADDYSDEDEEYTRPAPPRRRKKKPSPVRERVREEEEEDDLEEEYPVNRRRKQRPRARPQSNRRPVEPVDDLEDEFEDDPPETSATGAGLVPVGTSASRGKGVFDRPRAPPKIRPPVPLNEREKYNYGRNGAGSSSASSGGPSAASKSRDDSQEEVVERRVKKRPTPPPPALSKSRDEYYDEEEEEEEYVRIPPSRGSQLNRRRKGQGTRVKQVEESEEDPYEYDAKEEQPARDTDRYSSGGRDGLRRRKRPQAAASATPARRRRPGYRRDEEDEYEYEEEEERIRPTGTRYKESYPKGSSADDEDYRERDRYPSRQSPSRGGTDPPVAPSRKRAPQQSSSRASPTQDRARPQSTNYRKRIPTPVHEDDKDSLEEGHLEDEVSPTVKERSNPIGERVRVVKQRVPITTTTTTTTTSTTQPPPPVRSKYVPRNPLPPPPLKEKDILEEDDYYDVEDEVISEPKIPEPTNSRRPFARPSGPSGTPVPFVGSGRSVPSTSSQSFLPRGLQALGDRAQKKEVPQTPVVTTTLRSIQSFPSTTTPLVVTQNLKAEEPRQSEGQQKYSNAPQSYKPLTQYNARQQVPKQETEAQPQGVPFTRSPYVSNARPGYTTKAVPAAQYQQKSPQSSFPSQPAVDSVPNQTDYEEDDLINDALHPTIPSSSGFPTTAAASSLGGRHGISLTQQQRTTLSTPTQISYRFRNAPQSSPLPEYRGQAPPSNPSFTNRGTSLYQSASDQTLSIVQAPQFMPHSIQQRELHNAQQTSQPLYHRLASSGYQGLNSWSTPTRIIVY